MSDERLSPMRKQIKKARHLLKEYADSYRQNGVGLGAYEACAEVYDILAALEPLPETPIPKQTGEGDESLRTFLLWVAESYTAHARASTIPDEIEAYQGSAAMARKHYIRLLTSAPSTQHVEADGWVLVPREPTEAMMNAAPASHSATFKAIWPKICGDIYRAMIAASPKPSGDESGKGSE